MRSLIASGVLAALTLALSACVSHPTPSCGAGRQSVRTAQLFFGQAGAAGFTETGFRKFMDDELRPRFPDGLTVLEGGPKWPGPENQLFRDSAKVVVIVLPQKGDAGPRIAAVRAAYKARFRNDSVLNITQPACLDF